jgi:hypothetical protein
LVNTWQFLTKLVSLVAELLDTDFVEWLTRRVKKRTAIFPHPILQGVTYRLTQGVVKNIIPAVASTNAIIAAACANEVLKIATGCAPPLKNYMFVNGTVCRLSGLLMCNASVTIL